MKNILFILITFVIIVSLFLAEIYEVKKEAREQVETIRQQTSDTLRQQQQKWQRHFFKLEQDKKIIEKEAQLKITQLQAQIESLKSDYEKKLIEQQHYWQQEIERVKAQIIEERQQKVRSFLMQAQQMMEEANFSEAIKYYCKVLALAPNDQEALQGLAQAESSLDIPLEIDQISRRLDKLIRRLEKPSQRQFDRLSKELQRQRIRTERLKQQMQEQIKRLETQLQAEHQAWLELSKNKKVLEEQNQQLKEELRQTKDEWQKQQEQIREELNKQLVIERQMWQRLLTRLEEKYQSEIKAQEELWQARLKSVEEQARIRIQALEEDIQNRVAAERELWQERFEILQNSLLNSKTIQSEISTGNINSKAARVEVNLQVVDKKKALDLLDQAIVYLRDGSYKKAHELLEKSSKLDPENNMIQQILDRLKILLDTQK